MQLKTKRATGMFVQMFGNGTTLFQKEVSIFELFLFYDNCIIQGPQMDTKINSLQNFLSNIITKIH